VKLSTVTRLMDPDQKNVRWLAPGVVHILRRARGVPAAGCGDQDPDRRQLRVTWSAARVKTCQEETVRSAAGCAEDSPEI